jgi:hypothetical protein
MPPVGFEPTIPAIERPYTHALDHTVTAIDRIYSYSIIKAATVAKFHLPSASSVIMNLKFNAVLPVQSKSIAM